MARKSAGSRVSLKALIPLVMMYINFKIDYKNENTVKWIRFLFMTSLTLVRLGRGRARGVASDARGAAGQHGGAAAEE